MISSRIPGAGMSTKCGFRDRASVELPDAVFVG
jgi:hypothetical protein